MLLFPELSVTGYHGAVRAWYDGGLPSPDDLLELTRGAGAMAVSLGVPQEARTGLLHNAQVIVHGGAVAHVHHKLNLPTYGLLEEGKHFTPGTSVRPLELHGWRIATLICADLWNPALPWLAALAGADLVLSPVASAAGAVADEFDTAAGWSVTLQHTALLYGLPVAMANWSGGPYWGGSRIVGPDRSAPTVLQNEPGQLSTVISLDKVRHARRLLPTARDARPDFILRELNRLMGSPE